MVILALDDEIGCLKLLQKAILAVRPQAQTFVFQRESEALEFAKTTKVDVAFLDIQMSTMMGTEVAGKLQELNPKINIIFTTGYSEFSMDAIQLRSSGYLLKPILKADVENELDHLRNPIEEEIEEPKSRVQIRAFGSFDVFVDGHVLSFRRERAKEMLAYLVDRRGSLVTRKELAAVLFEDQEYTRAMQTYLTQIIQNLKTVLTDDGIGDLLIVEYNGYAVDPSKFTCDSYGYLDGDPECRKLYHGEYMQQYSWAEESRYQFEE